MDVEWYILSPVVMWIQNGIRPEGRDSVDSL
jgi:hypothetical protein